MKTHLQFLHRYEAPYKKCLEKNICRTVILLCPVDVEKVVQGVFHSVISVQTTGCNTFFFVYMFYVVYSL